MARTRKTKQPTPQPIRGRKPPTKIEPSEQRRELYALVQDSRKYNRERLTLQLLDYTDATDLPIMSEFCLVVGVNPSYLKDLADKHPPLARARELCLAKKEVALEKRGLEGTYHPAMTIFSLKQLGWRDTHELTGKNGGPIEVKRSAADYSDDELAAIAARGRTAPAEPAEGEDQPD